MLIYNCHLKIVLGEFRLEKIKILHCADLHIGANESFLGERANSRRAEALITFEKTVDFALENGVRVFLIAGDLLDSNRIESSFAERILSKVKEAAGIEFVYAAGNHDPLNSESPFLKMKIPENFHILPAKDGFFEVEKGVKVYGKSFCEVLCKGEEKFSLEPDENCINIMCIHGEYGISGDHNPINDNFIINSGMDYIALGHVHARTEPEKIGNTYVAYSGCIEGLGFDELGEKGVYIGYVGKNLCDLTFVKMAKRQHIAEKADISDCNENAEVANKILEILKGKYGEDFADNLYKIVLTGQVDESFSPDLTEIAERIKDKTYFAKIKDKTEIKFNLEQLKTEKSLKGIFTLNMLEKMESEPQSAERLNEALKLGLRAFSGEVQFDEDN